MMCTMRSGMAMAALAGAMLSVPALSVRAQRDSLGDRARGTPSGFEAEVERVARELSQKRRVQIDLSRLLQQLAAQVQQVSSEVQRSQTEQAMRQIRLRYEVTSREGSELRKRLLSLCKEERKPDGWLGVAVDGNIEFGRDDDGQLVRRYLDYPSIVSVEPGSPAEKGGVRAGDLLVVIGGQEVRGRDIDFSSLLRPGTRLPVRVRRGVETRTLSVMVERRPDGFRTPCPWIDESIANAMAEAPREFSFEFGPPPPGAPGSSGPLPMPPAVAMAPRIMRAPAPEPAVAPDVSAPIVWSFSGTGTTAIAGMQVTPMNADLSDVFGVSRGLLVIKVLPGTPADGSGLHGGDVILSADGLDVAEPFALQRVVNRARDRQVDLLILRKKKQLALPLKW